MQRENFNDLMAFILVAKEHSFTRSAAKLGISQSALSHTIRGLETRLNIRLLTRTTRSVSPTEAGERLLKSIGPHFEQIERHLNALSELRDKPAGTIRITASEHPINNYIWPKLKDFFIKYPDIHIEISVDYKLIDIVKEQYDAGVRIGDMIANDMIAVRIGPDMKMSVIASPDYFKKYPKPLTPQELTQHNCINLRFPTYDNLYAWEFEKDGHKQKVHVSGQLTFNLTTHKLKAALAGLGLAYIPEDMARPYIAKGQLINVLEDWCAFYPGYYLYYPNRHHISSAFSLLVDALRYTP